MQHSNSQGNQWILMVLMLRKSTYLKGKWAFTARIVLMHACHENKVFLLSNDFDSRGDSSLQHSEAETSMFAEVRVD
jgi:hypothetical protein